MGSLVTSPLECPDANPVSFDVEEGRQSHNIITLGVKICRQFHYNANNTFNQPIEVHWALLQWKEADPPVQDWAVQLKDKFFRDAHFTGDRFTSFVDYTPKDKFRAIYNCASIDPENDIKIISHRKKVICSQDNNTTPSGKNTFKIDRYFKLDCKTEFNQGATQPHHPIFKVMWYNAQGPINFPTNSVGFPWLQTWNWNSVYY
jgi:hypothetical protein